jgi:hypothetical protein
VLIEASTLSESLKTSHRTFQKVVLEPMFYEKVMNMVIEQHIQSPNLLIYKWTSPIKKS